MPEEALIYEAKWNETEHTITSFEVDTQEDISGELEAFIRLNRLGHFAKAKAFFEEKLRPYIDQFPVFVEYADLLLEQGDFSRLSRFLDLAQRQGFTTEEIVLVDLLKTLSDIYVNAAWEAGFVQAQGAWAFLSGQSFGPDGLPSDVQVCCLFAHLHK
jgi:hypothetical protein